MHASTGTHVYSQGPQGSQASALDEEGEASLKTATLALQDADTCPAQHPASSRAPSWRLRRVRHKVKRHDSNSSKRAVLPFHPTVLLPPTLHHPTVVNSPQKDPLEKQPQVRMLLPVITTDRREEWQLPWKLH